VTAIDTNTQLPSIGWRTSTLTNGDEFTSLHIGHVTVGTTTADVELFHDQEWFVNVRAKGRSEYILNGAGLLSGPDGLHLSYHVETADIAPFQYLAAAPAALAYYRPLILPGLQWEIRPTRDEHTAYQAQIATIEDSTTGMTTTVFALVHQGLLDNLQSNPVDMSMHVTDGNKRTLYLPVASREAALPELFERLRTAPQFLG
jgi:hypothetical protein